MHMDPIRIDAAAALPLPARTAAPALMASPLFLAAVLPLLLLGWIVVAAFAAFDLACGPLLRRG